MHMEKARMNRPVLIAAAAAALVLAVGAGAAHANQEIEYPDGGTWIYGSAQGGTWGTWVTVYSHYDHWWKEHRSTACGGPQKESCVGTDWIDPGEWAYSEAKDWYGQNRAYW